MPSVFCDILTGKAPGYVITREGVVAAILSLEGHPLIAPLRCAARIADLTEAEAAALMPLAARVGSALYAATGCDGVNLVLSDGTVAGQGVPHLHLHVKPRWTGDDVLMRWDTTAISEPQRAQRASAVRRALGAAA